MSSQAQLSLVAPAPTAPRRKPHNTNRGRKFPPDPIRPEEFALMLENCVPLTVDASREGIPLYSLQGQLGHARLVGSDAWP